MVRKAPPGREDRQEQRPGEPHTLFSQFDNFRVLRDHRTSSFGVVVSERSFDLRVYSSPKQKKVGDSWGDEN